MKWLISDPVPLYSLSWHVIDVIDVIDDIVIEEKSSKVQEIESS